MIQGLRLFFLLGYLLLQLNPKCLGQEIPTFENSREGLETMFQFILNASDSQQVALTESLTPLRSDYDSVFVPSSRKKIFKYHQRLMKMADIIIRPLRENQTEILLWEATTESLGVYQGEARFFPGAYTENVGIFLPKKTFYRMKFVEPGRKLGTAFDVFTYINGNWRVFHRPWAAIGNR